MDSILDESEHSVARENFILYDTSLSEATDAQEHRGFTAPGVVRKKKRARLSIIRYSTTSRGSDWIHMIRSGLHLSRPAFLSTHGRHRRHIYMQQ